MSKRVKSEEERLFSFNPLPENQHPGTSKNPGRKQMQKRGQNQPYR